MEKPGINLKRLRTRIPEKFESNSAEAESDFGQFIRWYCDITSQSLTGLSKRMERHFTGFFRAMKPNQASPAFCTELYDLLVIDVGKKAASACGLVKLMEMSRVEASDEWRKVAKRVQKKV